MQLPQPFHLPELRSRSQELSTLSNAPAFEMCHWCTRPCCVAQCTPLASSAGRCSTACAPGPASTTHRRGHSCRGLSRHASPAFCPRFAHLLPTSAQFLPLAGPPPTLHCHTVPAALPAQSQPTAGSPRGQSLGSHISPWPVCRCCSRCGRSGRACASRRPATASRTSRCGAGHLRDNPPALHIHIALLTLLCTRAPLIALHESPPSS